MITPYANAMTVFTPQPGAPLFVDHVNDSMYGFGADGSVEQQSVDGLPAPAGPDPDCGYRVSDLPRTIPLGGDLIAWPFYARIAYFTGTETQLNVAIGGRIHSVPLQTGGVRAVYFPVTGPASDIFVSTGSPGVVPELLLLLLQPVSTRAAPRSVAVVRCPYFMPVDPCGADSWWYLSGEWSPATGPIQV